MKFHFCGEIVCEHDAGRDWDNKSFVSQPPAKNGRTLKSPYVVSVRHCTPSSGLRADDPYLTTNYDPEMLEAQLPGYEAKGFDCSQIRATIARVRHLNQGSVRVPTITNPR